MKNFDQFEISTNEMNSIDGGTFYFGFNLSFNFCAPKPVYCAPKPTYCAPKPPVTCPPPTNSCTPPKTSCLPSVVSATGH